MKIDLSLHPQRKTVFKGFTFHFLDPSSPYTEIVPLAGGQIDRTSLTYASQASSPLASHIVVFPSEESPELSSEASVTLKRPLSEAAAAWARRGWLPLAEQELMRALVFDGEMQRLVAGARRRWEEEMRERESVGLASDDSVETVESQSSDDSVETVESQSSDDSVETVESQSSVQQLSVKQSLMQRSSLLLQSSTLQPPTQQQSPIKTTSHLPLPATLRGLKRPQQTDDGDDVEAFFREVDNGEAKRVREKERTSCSARVESESAESEPFLSDELESEHEEKVQNEVAEIRVEETTSGKGKRFKKKAFKKATGLVPLHPYQGSLVS